MFKKIKTFATCLALLLCLSSTLAAQSTYAASDPTLPKANIKSDPCHPEKDNPPGPALTTQQAAACEACNGIGNASDCLQKNPIIIDLNEIIDGIAGIIGVTCIAMMVVGGIRYSMARNNPQDVAAARKHIINALVALIFFAFIWALMQFLVPGGAFK